MEKNFMELYSLISWWCDFNCGEMTFWDSIVDCSVSVEIDVRRSLCLMSSNVVFGTIWGRSLVLMITLSDVNADHYFWKHNLKHLNSKCQSPQWKGSTSWTISEWSSPMVPPFLKCQERKVVFKIVVKDWKIKEVERRHSLLCHLERKFWSLELKKSSREDGKQLGNGS